MRLQKDEDRNWTDRKAVNHFIVWLVLWIVIDLAIVTWIFSSAPGEAWSPDRLEVFAVPQQVFTGGRMDLEADPAWIRPEPAG